MKTSITKMTVAISAMMLSILICTSAYASDYKPMIRYDRVWECVCNDMHWNYTVKYMKFTGTEEIQGKTYHRLATFKKYVGIWNFDIQMIVVNEVFDDIDEHEGYMREEDGVVYTLVFDDGCYWFDKFENLVPAGELYIPDQCTREGEIIEYPIYDFNREEGEVFNAVTMCMERVETEDGSSIWKPDLAETMDFEVIEKKTVMIDGEECRYIRVRPDFEDGGSGPWTETYIEGIGAVWHGCLSCHWYVWLSNGLETHNFFNRVYDIDGNELYSKQSSKDFIFDEVSVDGLKDTQSSFSQMYDMLGRRIYYPAPGQIYVRDGKKHVAGLD